MTQNRTRIADELSLFKEGSGSCKCICLLVLCIRLCFFSFHCLTTAFCQLSNKRNGHVQQYCVSLCAPVPAFHTRPRREMQEPLKCSVRVSSLFTTFTFYLQFSFSLAELCQARYCCIVFFVCLSP